MPFDESPARPNRHRSAHELPNSILLRAVLCVRRRTPILLYEGAVPRRPEVKKVVQEAKVQA